MSYEPYKFFGATVTNLDMRLSNDDSAQIQLRLVEDLDNGDSFTEGTIGHPYSFTVGDITVRGLLQSQMEDSSPQGSPVYTVRLVSPTSLLDGTSLILSDYRETIDGVPNLLNIFGYYEDAFGYGGSYINDLGMVWEAENIDVTYNDLGQEVSRTSNGSFGIKAGIEDLQVSTNEDFGGPIQYRDNTYILDLSDVPETDSNWRFNGANGSATMRDVIDAVCGDHGYDWFPELTAIDGTGPHTIKIRTIDRRSPRLLDQIDEYLTGKSGYISKQLGKEANYEQTNLFLVGANVEELWQQATTGAILPFWGFDSNGIARQGSGLDDSYTVIIDCSEISDIIGGTDYMVSVAELRCALANQDTWCAFLLMHRNELALAINAISATAPIDTVNPPEGYRFSHDFVTQSPYFANIASNANYTPGFYVQMNRLYQFVLRYAKEWFGRRWIVPTPNLVTFRLEADTNRVIYDWEPIDSVFLENGSQPLGLSVLYEDSFQDSNYRWTSFVRFDNAELIDPNTLNNNNVVIYNNKLYVPCKVMHDVGIFYMGGISCVAIELDSPAYYYPGDFLGGIDSIKDLFSIINNDWATYRTDSPLRYGPMVATPEAAAIPFRSNSVCYGPWKTDGVPGATIYRKEEGLAPWNYGGFTYMDLAAEGYLQDFVRESQVEENGSITYAGLPDRNIGDEITVGGSIITDAEISLSAAGVTTTYHLKSHTQRPGAFGKTRAERLSRIGQNQLRFGKNLIAASRKSFNQINRNANGQALGSNGRYTFNEKISKMVRQETPHGCLVAHTAVLNGDKIINLLSSQTYAESIQSIGHTGIFKNSACSSMDAVFRPFSVDPTYDGYIPKFSSVGESGRVGTVVNVSGINPFQNGHDLDWFSFGNNYSGVHARKTTVDNSKIRSLGMRMPQVGVGWGYDWWGKPVPNTSGNILPQNLSNDFISGHLHRSNEWKAGPVAQYWDPERGVWGVPTKVKGILDRNVTPGNEGILALYYNGDITNHRLTVMNDWLRTTCRSGFMTHAYFDQWENKWIIDNQECLHSNLTIPDVPSGVI